MNRLTIIFSFVLFAVTSQAQILNSGFEDFYSVPDALGQFDRCLNWTNAGSASATPDYYHYHALGDVDLPNTLIANVEAYEGEGIMGLVVCGAEGTNKREYISTHFEAPLTVGEDYLVSFRICNGYITDNSYTGFGVDHLGVALTTGAPVQSGDSPLFIAPQFEIDSVLFDRDWTQISFIINADDAYEYLTFGVFRDDSSQEFVSYEDNAIVAYYFVDDFFMMELPEDYDPTLADTPRDDSSGTVTVNPDEPEEETGIQPFFIPNAFTPNGDGENDLFTPVSDFPEGLNGYKFEIFSRWGEMLFSSDTMNEGWDGEFRGQPMNTDVYVWYITYNEVKGEAVFTRKFNGSVNLIR